MVGIKKFKLLLGIFIPIFCFFLMSHNTSAISGHYHVSIPWNDYVWVYTSSQASSWGYNPNVEGKPFYDGVDPINGITFNVSLDQISDNYGNSTSGSIKFTLAGSGSWGVDGGDLTNVTCEVWTKGGASRIQSNMYLSKGYYSTSSGHAVDYSCEFEAINKAPAYVFIRVGTARNGDSSIIPIMGSYQMAGARVQPNVRNVSYDYYTSNESVQAGQLGDLINGQKNIYNQNQEYYDKNYEAVDNIDNQSSSDIQGSENAQTTNLINVISGFISAFSGISAGNCNLTLEFPNYAGGTRVVNICSGKEKAPRIVEIGSSLLLICVFVPLAYILIRMIYNEIRSWTNG